jgi:hypothetical protein
MNNSIFTRIVEMLAEKVIASRLDEVDAKKYVGGKGKTGRSYYSRGVVKQLGKSDANLAKIEKRKGKPIDRLKKAQPSLNGGTQPNPGSNRSAKKAARRDAAIDGEKYEKSIKDTEHSLRGKL